MRWQEADFSHRFPVVLNGSATAAGTVDATIAIDSTAALFWETIQADADDVRVGSASGLTAIDYDLESLNTSTKTVTIELDGLAHHVTNTMTIVWVYFGDADATNSEDGITTSSPLTGYTLFTGPAPGEPIFTLENRLDETTPTQRLRKREDETAFAWFQIGPLGMLSEPYNGRLFGEGPQSLVIEAPSPGTLVASTSLIRVWQAQNGTLFARATLSAGTTATDYDVVLTVYTTEGRVLTGVVRVSVLD